MFNHVSYCKQEYSVVLPDRCLITKILARARVDLAEENVDSVHNHINSTCLRKIKVCIVRGKLKNDFIEEDEETIVYSITNEKVMNDILISHETSFVVQKDFQGCYFLHKELKGKAIVGNNDSNNE